MREEVEDALRKTQSVSEGLLNGAQYWGFWKYLDRVEVGLALGSIGDMLSSLGKILLAGKRKTVSFVDKKQIIHVPALQDLLSFLVHGIDNSVARGGLLLVISSRRCSCIGHGDGDGERK